MQNRKPEKLSFGNYWHQDLHHDRSKHCGDHDKAKRVDPSLVSSCVIQMREQLQEKSDLMAIKVVELNKGTHSRRFVCGDYGPQ